MLLEVYLFLGEGKQTVEDFQLVIGQSQLVSVFDDDHVDVGLTVLFFQRQGQLQVKT